MNTIEQVVIIGSGPAGLTAAIYAARGNLNPVVVAGRQPGGQLTETTEVDDFPGFPDGVLGPQLMQSMRKQAERFETRFIDQSVISVDLKKTPFTITTEDQTIQSKAVIIATGASAKWLGLPSEQKLIGRGVSCCGVCDGPFFKDKKIIVVGGGDAAMRETQYLSKFASELTVIHRKDKLKAQPALQEIVKSKPNVKFLFNSEVVEVLGEDRVTGVKVKDVLTQQVTEMTIDGMFVAVGHLPNTKFLAGQLELNPQGYIVVTNETKTSLPGVFVAGDVADFKYRQAVSAAGAGCKAALDVEDYLEQLLLPNLTS